MKLIFIGEHFYEQSGSLMSSLYDENGFRQDWGKVRCALRSGETVHIRPATSNEQNEYQAKLEQVKLEQQQPVKAV